MEKKEWYKSGQCWLFLLQIFSIIFKVSSIAALKYLAPLFPLFSYLFPEQHFYPYI
jgi:hypothetical protein